MSTMEFKSSKFEVEITHSGALPLMTDSLILNFVVDMEKLHDAVDLDTFEVVEKLIPPLPYPVFTYTFITKGGREWAQELHFDNGTNINMTFAVPDLWRLLEFTPHRKVRDSAALLIAQYTVTKISATFA